MKGFTIPGNLKLNRSDRLHVLINSGIKGMVFQRALELNVSVADYINYLIGKDLHALGRLPEVDSMRGGDEKEKVTVCTQ